MIGCRIQHIFLFTAGSAEAIQSMQGSDKAVPQNYSFVNTCYYSALTIMFTSSETYPQIKENGLCMV